MPKGCPLSYLRVIQLELWVCMILYFSGKNSKFKNMNLNSKKKKKKKGLVLDWGL